MTPIASLQTANNGQSVALANDLYAFRLPKQRFRHGQSYALLRGKEMILIDAVHAITKEAVDALRQEYNVVALLITHSDLIGQAFDKIAVLETWLGAKAYAHPADHQGQELKDVTKQGNFLSAYQLSVHAVPGHTPGSVVYYDQQQQRLFTGDAAVGHHYEKQGTPFTHAPISSAWWPRFEQGWKTAPSLVQQVFPLHGQPDFDLESWEEFLASMLTVENVMRE